MFRLFRSFSFLSITSLASLTACGAPDEDDPSTRDATEWNDTMRPMSRKVTSLQAQDDTALGGSTGNATPFDARDEEQTGVDPSLSDFETELPQSKMPRLRPHERRLLLRYLDNPQNMHHALSLGRRHIFRFFRESRPRKRAWKELHPRKRAGQALKHAILAQYFFQRALDLGAPRRRIQRPLKITRRYLDYLLATPGSITADENRDAHRLFRKAFHFEEGKRFAAQYALLNEFANDPNNVYTSSALTTLPAWMGSESASDDPTVLYDFVVGSFFSLRTMDQARTLEEQYLEDPSSTSRFRLAANLGGFSTVQRRWLATFHQDEAAVEAIDDEHRQWMTIHPSFHAISLGTPFFEEEEHLLEGLQALLAATPHCEATAVRTCSNRPRFYFNRLAFTLTIVDFLLKLGQVDEAQQTLGFRFDPAEADSWNNWELGQEAWLHREANAAAIAALYNNDDPSDDPTHFQLRKKDWGMSMTTCQTCHQTQGKEWTDEEFAEVILPPEEVATVGSWPEVPTTWYGTLLEQE